MKYYCKKCGSVLEITEETMLLLKQREAEVDRDPHEKLWDGESMQCNVCVVDDSPVAWMNKIPDYETPEQFQERTGKAYPNDGLVWMQNFPNNGDIWRVYIFEEAIRTKSFFPDRIFVIADPPVPPPDDWRIEK